MTAWRMRRSWRGACFGIAFVRMGLLRAFSRREWCMRRIWVAVLGVAPWLAGGCGDALPRLRGLSGEGGTGAPVSTGSAGSDPGTAGTGRDGAAGTGGDGAAGTGGGGAAGTGGGGAGGTGGGGTGGSSGTGGTMTSARGCSDLFDSSTLAAFRLARARDRGA